MTTAGAPIEVAFPPRDLPRDFPRDNWDVSNFRQDQKVPPPRYRHAAPSAPWPWMDFDKDDAQVVPLSPGARETWDKYPQSHFGNWTKDQVERCRMLTICKKDGTCHMHKVDVFKDGTFDRPDEEGSRPRQILSDTVAAGQFWGELQGALDPNLRVRALFIEDISLNVLQVLGARYDIEPFFFASSANWIPSRYQENPHAGEGDHITVVLPFIRAINNRPERDSPVPSNDSRSAGEKGPDKAPVPVTDKHQTIDTQAPLVLSPQKILLQDLLAIHMVRSTTDNVIISYHHNSEFQKTTASRLRSLVQRTGDSVYWQKLYGRSRDPTFIFLAILWYALYAWDEAFEVLYAHLSERIEGFLQEASDVDTRTMHTRELHKLQAHLLYYRQLLNDFHKSVRFVRSTPNPAMDEDPDRDNSRKLLERESDNLLFEIERLQKQRLIQSDRLQNAIHLSFSTVNIEDSRTMQELTKATMRDSAAMKQISYLTMIFLPATYLSSVFGMNVAEINGPAYPKTIGTYVESTVILTVITTWVVIALHKQSKFHPGEPYVLRRVAWPVFYGYARMQEFIAACKEYLSRWAQDSLVGR